MQANPQAHFFLEAFLSTSAHISLVMAPYTTAGAKAALKAQSNSLDELKDKAVGRLKKRLHHEFRCLVADEWSACRET